ncbi:MAG TPA: zinc-ribbon domain-containing protein [Sphingomicrobium sp.]|nr:zinc-ribbon domain-containing protein [Sphingomicrobium sp.]
MILTCPNCGTQYVVKDGAVPPEGRQVRCAACKHSWHQDPPAAEAAEEAPAPVPSEAEKAVGADHDTMRERSEATPDEDESLAGATLIEPRSGPEAEERAYEEALARAPAPESEAQSRIPPQTADEVAGDGSVDGPEAEAAPVASEDWKEPPEPEAAPDTFSPFAADEVAPRRRGPVSTIVILVLAVIILAALFWFLAPANLKARLGLAATDATPLQLVTTHMDRQHLESGNDLLTLTGRVINPSPKEQIVPPIQAQLKNKSGQIVYSWTIQPPAPSLAAGASASFNSAEVSVPPGGEELTITLGRAAGRSG